MEKVANLWIQRTHLHEILETELFTSMLKSLMVSLFIQGAYPMEQYH